MNYQKYFLLLLFLIPAIGVNAQLKDCPSSPNCVSTNASKKSKRLAPIAMTQSLDETKNSIKALMKQGLNWKNARLINEAGNFLQYEVTTKTGKFIDEVDFLIDEEKKIIHFRSASRVGYHDLGANKRRMKKISKALQ